jgi:hypothetical protein
MHGTNQARFEDLVSFESRGSSYLLGEGGPERGNLFKHLLAANPRSTKLGTDDFDAIGQRDNGPSGFWSAASNNTFTDLHVAGVQDGWGVRFDFDRFTKNRGILAGTPGNPSKNPAGIIDGIVAHAIAEPVPGHVCDRFICGTAVFISAKGRLKNSNKRWDGEYDSQFTFGPYAMNRVVAWKSHVGVWATRGVNLTNSAVADTCRAYVLQDARLDSSLAMGLTGRGDGGNACGDTYQGTEAYDFKTVVTNSVFANYGNNGTKGGAFGAWGSQGHDQVVHYGVNAYFNVKLVNVANRALPPGPGANREVAANCTPARGPQRLGAQRRPRTRRVLGLPVRGRRHVVPEQRRDEVRAALAPRRGRRARAGPVGRLAPARRPLRQPRAAEAAGPEDCSEHEAWAATVRKVLTGRAARTTSRAKALAGRALPRTNHGADSGDFRQHGGGTRGSASASIGGVVAEGSDCEVNLAECRRCSVRVAVGRNRRCGGSPSRK